LQPKGTYLAQKFTIEDKLLPGTGFGKKSLRIRMLNHTQIDPEDVPYLESLWRELLRRVPASVSIADPRLIAVQAAHIAVANRFQPVPKKILNANTAFQEELTKLSAASLFKDRMVRPILSHPDPGTSCWYCC